MSQSTDAKRPIKVRSKRPLSTKPTAVANRRWRKRANVGTMMIQIEGTENRVEKLIACGHLHPHLADSSDAVRKAMESLLDNAQTVRLKSK